MANGTTATFAISAKQLWTLVLLLIAAMGGGSTYVGQTARNLSTDVAVLTETVRALTRSVDASENHAAGERREMRDRIGRLEDHIFRGPVK